MRRTIHGLFFVLALAGALGGPAAAEDWTGPAGVGVEVRDEAGQPIAGAAVVLAPGGDAAASAGGGDAPPFVFTDAGGRVEVRNLAEGEWQVEVRAAGYMIFNGYLRLASATAPEVGFSSRQRTGTFWQPLQVRFFVPGSPGDAVMVAATKEERRGEKKRLEEKSELERQEKKAEERAEVREKREAKALGSGEVATLKEAPKRPPAEPPKPPPAEPKEPPPRVAEVTPPQTAPPKTVAEPPPARERGRPAPPPPPTGPVAPPPARPAAPPPSEPRVADVGTRPSPNVAPAEPGRAAPAVPAAALAPAAPAPAAPAPAAPAPAAPAAAAPAAAVSAPAAPAAPDVPRAVPSIQTRPVLFTGGACPECKPGEWALIVERRAAAAPAGAAAGTGCGEGRDAAVKRLAREVLVPAGSAVAAFAGPVADGYGNGLPAASWETVPADLAAALRPRDGACQDFVGVLPKGARFIGFRFEAEDGSGKGDCFGEEACAIGQARWSSNPRIERTTTVTVVHSSFVNESTSAERRARMTLYFQPPRGWRPPA